jgi:hypothetical protein
MNDPYAYEVQVHLDGTVAMVPVDAPFTYTAPTDSAALDLIAAVVDEATDAPTAFLLIADIIRSTGRVDETLDAYATADQLLQQRAESLPNGIRGAIAQARLNLMNRDDR